MRYRNRIIILILVIVLLTGLEYALPGHPGRILVYDEYVFHPYQSFRNFLFGHLPFSAGDILYIAAGLALIIVIIRWVYFAIKFRTHKHYLAASLIHTLITLGVVYTLFIVGWGANYYKPSLSKYWHIKTDTTRAEDSASIVSFDKYLIDKLNVYAPHYHPLSFQDVDDRCEKYYGQYTDSKFKLSGLNAKSSMFGFFLQNLGIQGYYNTFTGEAQVNRFLPRFMLPFVVCHEMAHQCGIAAEGDANLLSYVLGTTVNDSAFNYSCYFNIWIYTHNRVFRYDTTLARSLTRKLNSLTRSQLDTLKEIRQRYEGDISEYSSQLYDSYLRMHDQKGGIRSYGNVVQSAWAWEKRRWQNKNILISIP